MKLFVFDVDGTISSDGLTISKATINSIQKRLDNGDAMAIASGRPYIGINKYLSLFNGKHKYSIGSNGAIIQDKDGKVLGRNGLLFKDFLYLYDKYKYFEGNGAQIYAYDKNGNVIAFKKTDWTDDEILYNGVQVRIISRDSFDPEETILKVMFCANPKTFETFELCQEYKDKYNLVPSDPKYLEIVNKNTDKALGVELLARRLGINNDDIYCFGDQHNDYMMIKKFHGIAMGNAIEDCKEVAEYVTLDVKSDGVSYALEHYIKW